MLSQWRKILGLKIIQTIIFLLSWIGDIILFLTKQKLGGIGALCIWTASYELANVKNIFLFLGHILGKWCYFSFIKILILVWL